MVSRVVFSSSVVAVRQPRSVSGVAAPFEVYARIDRNRKEKIKRSAFTRSLSEIQQDKRDVALLVDHNPEKLLARTRTGSLTLSESDKGLMFQANLPDTTLGRDIKQMSDDGLLSGVSIGFRPRGKSTRVGKQIDMADDEIPMMRPSPDTGALEGSSWIEGRNSEDGSEWRVLTEVDLQEISLLTGNNPAFPRTSVESRSEGLANWIRIYEII